MTSPVKPTIQDELGLIHNELSDIECRLMDIQEALTGEDYAVYERLIYINTYAARIGTGGGDRYARSAAKQAVEDFKEEFGDDD